MSASPTVHADAVLLGETGVLIRGPSGSGKSALVLALLQADPAAHSLVADDRVVLTPAHGRLLATVPASIAGLIEFRGLGILRFPFVSPVVLRLVVDLMPAEECPRLPAPEEERVVIEGVALPLLCLPIGIADGASRIRLAITRGDGASS